MKKDQVILVDVNDKEIGIEEKIEAHRKAKLHRAFSVFLFDGDKILLQKRAKEKYHCGGLWTNTCCSHPAPGEAVDQAAIRRLQEELGIVTEEIREVGSILYYYPFSNGLTEYEFDHLFIGEYQGAYQINPDEVEALVWKSMHEIDEEIRLHPETYTPWFIIAYQQLKKYIR